MTYSTTNKVRGHLIDVLVECVNFLKNRGFEIVEGPTTIATGNSLDLSYGLRLQSRDFRYETWVHAVFESGNIYLYAVLFITSMFKNTKGFFPTVRTEIVDYSRKGREFAMVIFDATSYVVEEKIFDRLPDLEKIKKRLENTYNIETRLTYLEVNEKWFEENEKKRM